MSAVIKSSVLEQVLVWGQTGSHVAYVLAIEAVLLCIIQWKWVQAGKQFSNYMKQNHPDFFTEHLDAPLWAGGPEMFLRQFRAQKFAYRGQMPDAKSSHYQKVLRKWVRLWLIGFLVFTLSFVAFISLAYFGFVLE